MAHEFGHIEHLATVGYEWYKKYYNDNIDCQDRNNWNLPQVETAIKWQQIFDCKQLNQGGN
ncbi:MAG: hypothetical protein LBC68_06605 [Prevotellaceae bacterium]|jgi:hypothetical protein|nr:hypothetical protein [Prevotellaceae bacterium]